MNLTVVLGNGCGKNGFHVDVSGSMRGVGYCSTVCTSANLIQLFTLQFNEEPIFD